jgi:outer membrane protein assembly factor BamB
VTADVSPNAQSSGGYMSEDGKFFIAEFSRGDKSYEVALFNVSNKKQQWVKNFEDEIVSSIAVSPKGKFTIIRTNNRNIYVYSNEGKQLQIFQTEHIGGFKFAFDNEEKYVAIATGFGELYCIDLDALTIRWKYFTGDTNVPFLDVDYSSGYIAASVTTESLSDASLPRYLYVFNLDGDLLLKKRIIGHGFEWWNDKLQVRIKDLGKKVLINLPDKLLEFENEFEK